MKYRLYNTGNNDTSNILKEVLKNRGIDDYKRYLNLDKTVVGEYNDLSNITEGTILLADHINRNSKIAILIDEDVDGFCSAAMMYSYLKSVSNCPLEYIIHKKTKSHGLDEAVLVAEDVALLIIPDASTNDVEQYTKLNEEGLDILILDHHEWDEKAHKDEIASINGVTIIVNNQISENYSNKELCGAGIVYRFLEAMDSLLWEDSAENFLDLCALANIADVMDMRSFETRYLVEKGLQNIKNKCFKAFIESQSYRMKDTVNVHNIQWYVVPALNGLIRMGDFDNKDLLFRALIETDEVFKYTTRATKNKPSETIDEDIYHRVARIATNEKGKQDRLRNKALDIVSEMDINNDDKVVIIDVTNVLEQGLTGVAAIQVSEKLKKPCLMIKKDPSHSTKDNVIYSGSARNFNNSPIADLKEVITETNLFEFARGHANAFGVSISENNIKKATEMLNNMLSNVEFDKTYIVDFILDSDDVNIKIATDAEALENVYGQGIDEYLIAVENIVLNRSDFIIQGKTDDTIKFEINGLTFLKFRCKQGDVLYDFVNDSWGETTDTIKLNLVGVPEVNKFNGHKIPQVAIKDMEIIEIKCESENLEESEDW